MTGKLLAGLALAAVLVSSPVVSQGAGLSKSELKECIGYYDQIVKKRGNVKELKSVIADAESMIESFDNQMAGVENQLSHTIGYRRNELIHEYNSLNKSRSKFVYVRKMAVDKIRKRIRQHDTILEKFNEQCVATSASESDLEEVCSGRGGYCDQFED